MADAAVPVEAHLERILAAVAPLPPVEVTLGDALGLVLAEQVTAAVAVPRFDHAAMDGYAVRAVDVAAAGDSPAVLKVVGSAEAGAGTAAPVGPGGAVRIMTGALIPDGADAVVPFEWTDSGADGDDEVAVHRAAESGRNIRRRGEEVAEGEVVGVPGQRLRAGLLGMLAAAGVGRVAVRPRPRVALLTTGTELVPAGTPVADLSAGAVHDSNAVALAAAVRTLGGEPVAVGPARDEREEFLALLTGAAAGADLVVTVGGISAGDRDVVRVALAPGGTVWFGPVAVRPGRPQGAGRIVAADGRAVPLVALPGTPAAAYVALLLFAAPALRALEGRPPRRVRRARLGVPLSADAVRVVVLPGVLDHATGSVVPIPAGRHTEGAAGGSIRMTSSDPNGGAAHSLRALAEADALLVVPPSGRLLPAGTEIEVLALAPEDT